MEANGRLLTRRPMTLDGDFEMPDCARTLLAIRYGPQQNSINYYFCVPFRVTWHSNRTAKVQLTLSKNKKVYSCAISQDVCKKRRERNIQTMV